MNQAEVPRRELSQEESVAYEVAKEILADLVGYATNQIDAEQTKPQPDNAVVESWETRANEWAALLRALRPRDTARVRTVLDEYGALLRTLRQQSS